MLYLLVFKRNLTYSSPGVVSRTKDFQGGSVFTKDSHNVIETRQLVAANIQVLEFRQGLEEKKYIVPTLVYGIDQAVTLSPSRSVNLLKLRSIYCRLGCRQETTSLPIYVMGVPLIARYGCTPPQ